MPYNGTVHIWIRQEDRKAWDAIENKAEWLHECLNTGTGLNALKAVQSSVHSVNHIIEDRDFVNEVDDAVKQAEYRITPAEETA